MCVCVLEQCVSAEEQMLKPQLTFGFHMFVISSAEHMGYSQEQTKYTVYLERRHMKLLGEQSSDFLNNLLYNGSSLMRLDPEASTAILDANSVTESHFESMEQQTARNLGPRSP